MRADKQIISGFKKHPIAALNFSWLSKEKDEDVKEKEVVYVDRDTHIEGNIRTDELILEGTISGTVWADVVIMKKGSAIKGKVFTGSLLLDDEVQCDCELHLDRGYESNSDSAGETGERDRPEERQVAAVL